MALQEGENTPLFSSPKAMYNQLWLNLLEGAKERTYAPVDLYPEWQTDDLLL